MSDYFDTECMMIVIMNTEWGKAIADGTQFYRCLFKIDKKEKVTKHDINVMFASYRNWKLKLDKMKEECNNQTRDEVEALDYAEKTENDIIQHMHVIVSEKECDGCNMIEEFINKAKSIRTATAEKQAAVTAQASPMGQQ